jgi:hypothetical protein
MAVSDGGEQWIELLRLLVRDVLRDHLADERRDLDFAWCRKTQSRQLGPELSPLLSGIHGRAVTRGQLFTKILGMPGRRIKSSEKVLKDYFDRKFAERAAAHEKLFASLEVALESGDTSALQTIVAASSKLPAHRRSRGSATSPS